MRKMLTVVMAGCIALAGPASLASAGVFSAKGLVIAILAGDVFVGEAEGKLNGAGTLAIKSQKNPALSCVGQFTSSASAGGVGQMKCSDGAIATFSFQRLTVFRGYGVGSYSGGAMSFAYGFPAAEAGSYLKLPEGKTLRQNGTQLALADL